MTNQFNGATAKPLNKWKMRNGECFVFGAYNPKARVGKEVIGWTDVGMVACREAHGIVPALGESEYDIIGPWPADPVVFEATIQKQGYNEHYQGYIPHSEALNPFIGKRVKVTVEELP